MMDEKRRPVRVTSPGRVIARELDARGWTQKDLAQIMGRPEQAVSEIIRAKKQITPDTALELAEVFGTSPEFWANLEANYRLHLAAEAKRPPDISKKSQLYTLVPVGELLKRRWIGEAESAEELESAILAFLRQPSLGEAPALSANFRMAVNRVPDSRATLAWVRRVEFLAASQTVLEFDRRRLLKAIPDLLKLTKSAESLADVPDALQCLGVHFVVVPQLKHTYIDGAALRANGEPVVALSLRFDRLDSFWFTLMHELAHVALGHEGTYIDDLEDSASTAKSLAEKEADRTAGEWLLDSKALKRFVERSQRPLSLRSVEDFADAQSRHPAIVVGRLQHDRVVEWTHFRKTLVKSSRYLTEWIDSPGPEVHKNSRSRVTSI